MRGTNVRATKPNAIHTGTQRLTPISVHYVDDLVRRGRIIDSGYRLEEPLGDEPLANVWRASTISHAPARVAIRFLDAAIADDPDMLEAFFGEAQAAGAVQSEHVAQILDCGVDSGTPYVAMELVVGEPLEAYLETHHTLTLAQVDGLFSGLALALAAAHDVGVLHRDLRPANVFLVNDPPGISAKLAFGISKLARDTLQLVRKMQSCRTSRVETLAYMSPEQILGKGALDARSDLWSLAVMACECVTGQLPFYGTTLGEQLVQICTAPPVLPSALGPAPAGFDEWFARGVQKAPEERFPSLGAMAYSLHAILQRAVRHE